MCAKKSVPPDSRPECEEQDENRRYEKPQSKRLRISDDLELRIHGLHPEADDMTGGARTAQARLHRDANQPHPAGHPAGGRIIQGRSPGSRVIAPSPPSRGNTQWHDGAGTRRSQLRGQPRLYGPHVRYRIPVLAPDPQTNRREPRTLDMVYAVKSASTAMMILYRIRRG